MSLNCTTPYRKTIPKPPIESETYPRYGIGLFDDYEDENQQNSFMTGEHVDPEVNRSFAMPNATENLFFYYMAPLEYGEVSFKSDTGLAGGWDGASWPVDDVGEEYGPVIITYLGIQWRMYRTDFPGNLAATYTVSFANG